MENKIVAALFQHLPEFKDLIVAAESPEKARDAMLVHLKKMIEANIDDVLDLSGLQFSLKLSCARALRQFLSKRSVKITGFDMVRQFWLMIHEGKDEVAASFSPAFVEDFSRIIAGLAGKAGIYKKEDSSAAFGREAALARCEILDQIFLESEKKMEQYSCGLDEKLVERRNQNRRQICDYFKCSEDDFADFNWQLQHIIRNAATLKNLVNLRPEEEKAIDAAKEGNLPFGITPFYASLFCSDPGSGIDNALRAQVIPPQSYVDEVLQGQGERRQKFDFMRENDTSPIDLITRRYARIVIFKPYNTCSQICVYCQRNWEIDDAYIPQALATPEKIDKAIKWIRKNPAVTEVLVTGGDPLIMKDAEIEFILERLASIRSVRRIRFGTRTPVVLPQRFTDKLVEILSRHHLPGRREISIVTHFEHSLEVTPEAMTAVQKLRQSGMGVYNQAVYTFFNSRRFELAALRKALRLIGVDPYYTFNAKGKKETDVYRVPLARLQQEAKEEARLLPGIERTDEPVYNVPGLGKNYLRAEQNHLLLTILPDGRRVYEFHPWEKFIRHARSYVHCDVPIYDYLQRLEKIGENPEDYKSIYYYL